jgi:hypothetical protein
MSGDLESFLRAAAQSRQPQRRPDIEILEPAPPVLQPAPTPTPLKPLGQQPFGHSDEFTARAAHFGDKFHAADDRREAHRHQVFDHTLGKLGTSVLAAEVEMPSVAQQLALLMARPESLRQAFIFREVLRRPEW